MLARHRDYLLQDTAHLHAHIQIIPTGLVEVEIVEKRQCLAAEFDQLRFERSGRVTKLVGHHVTNGRTNDWQLPLAAEDAKELANLIEEATEELEILMRDL